MKKYIKDYVVLIPSAAIIVLLDQLTKEWVRNTLAVGEYWMPWEWLAPYVRFVHWTNTGVAFGMLQGMGRIFAILSVVVILAILYYYPQVPRKEWALRTAMALQLGGAIGNLIDRVTIGHVTDFISVGNFAVFNIADSAITVGVAILILGILIQEYQQKKQNQQSEPLLDKAPQTGEDQQ